MPKLYKIDNIMYRVSDLEKSTYFYQNALGMKKAWEDKDAKMVGFIFENSDSEIVIHNNKELPKFDYSYLVDDVEKFCRKYKSSGYKLVSKPVKVRSGKYAILQDLDDNKIPIIDLTKFSGKPRYN